MNKITDWNQVPEFADERSEAAYWALNQLDVRLMNIHAHPQLVRRVLRLREVTALLVLTRLLVGDELGHREIDRASVLPERRPELQRRPEPEQHPGSWLPHAFELRGLVSVTGLRYLPRWSTDRSWLRSLVRRQPRRKYEP